MHDAQRLAPEPECVHARGVSHVALRPQLDPLVDDDDDDDEAGKTPKR